MPTHEQEAVNDVRRALLGAIDEINGVLEKAPNAIQDSIQKLLELNRLSLTLAMLSGDTKEKEFAKKLASSLDQTIKPYLTANEARKLEMKQEQRAEIKKDAGNLRDTVESNMKPRR